MARNGNSQENAVLVVVRVSGAVVQSGSPRGRQIVPVKVSTVRIRRWRALTSSEKEGDKRTFSFGPMINRLESSDTPKLSHPENRGQPGSELALSGPPKQVVVRKSFLTLIPLTTPKLNFCANACVEKHAHHKNKSPIYRGFIRCIVDWTDVYSFRFISLQESTPAFGMTETLVSRAHFLLKPSIAPEK